jgi:hypothetical protein
LTQSRPDGGSRANKIFIQKKSRGAEERGDHNRVAIDPRQMKKGTSCLDLTFATMPALRPSCWGRRARYLVMRQQDVWFITFNGEEFGPYRSQREAMLFATDAAQRLGELGEDTQVFRVDENGDAAPVWTYGLDPYPPAS